MKIGTKFIGKINNHPFQLINVRSSGKSEIAIIKDLKNGKTFMYGMESLKHCEIEVIR